MKLSHKINHNWVRPEPPMTDRYEAEIQQAVAHAEKAHRETQKRLARAEMVHTKRPSPESHAALDVLRIAVFQRLEELREVEQLMRAAEPRGAHHSGRGSVRAVQKGSTL